MASGRALRSGRLLARAAGSIDRLDLARGWLRMFLRVQREANEAADLLEGIDWAKTRAYALGSPPQIFVNLRGRETAGSVDPSDYEKVRDEVCLLLSGLREPRCTARRSGARRRTMNRTSRKRRPC